MVRQQAVNIGHDAFENIGKKMPVHLTQLSGQLYCCQQTGLGKSKMNPLFLVQTDKIMLPGDFYCHEIYRRDKYQYFCIVRRRALGFSKGWSFKRYFKLLWVQWITDATGSTIILFAWHFGKEIAEKLSLKKVFLLPTKRVTSQTTHWRLMFAAWEVAATAGTSGVIYGVTNRLCFDTQSRINSFAHVNYDTSNKNIGVLLCINGTGIFNHWVKPYRTGTWVMRTQ